MSEPPLCGVERWPPLAPQSGGDRDRPGQTRSGAAQPRASLRPQVARTHLRRQGRGMGVPAYTQTALHPQCPHLRGCLPASAERAGQRLLADQPGCRRATPFPGSGSSPPPPGASSSSRSSSPPLPCRACTARDSHRRLRGGRARPSSPPAPLPLPPEPPVAPPHRLPVPPPDFSLLPRMRRPTRRLALSLLGVLWLAALLLFFFGARRKLEAAEPEGHTPEVRKGQRGRGCSGGTWAQCRRRPGKKFPAVFGTPNPIAFPSSLVPDPCLFKVGRRRGEWHGGPFRTPRFWFPPSPPSVRSRTAAAPAVPPALVHRGLRPAVPAPCPAASLEHPRLPGRGKRCAPRNRNVRVVSRVGDRRLLSPVGHAVLPSSARKERGSILSGLEAEGSRLGWSVFGVHGLGEPG